MDISTVQAHSLEWDEEAGYLSKMPVNEDEIDPKNRIPRVTSANWCVPLRTPFHASCLLNLSILQEI